MVSFFESLHVPELQNAHLDLQLHDISASRSPNQAGPHVWILRIHFAHVTRIIVVIYDLQRVSADYDGTNWRG